MTRLLMLKEDGVKPKDSKLAFRHHGYTISSFYLSASAYQLVCWSCELIFTSLDVNFRCEFVRPIAIRCFEKKHD